MSTKIQRSALVTYSCQQMFELVNHIEAYPEFMDGCIAARLISRSTNSLEAELTLSKAGVKQNFSTRNSLRPPESMSMELLDGPFKFFHGLWTFKALTDGEQELGCKVSLELDFEFKSRVLQSTVGRLFESTANQQVASLCRRAEIVYAENRANSKKKL